MEANRKSSTLQNSLDGTVERVASSAHDVVDKAERAANAATRQISRKGDEVLTMGDRYVEQAADQVRDHPFVALGAAALAGFLLSFLFARR